MKRFLIACALVFATCSISSGQMEKRINSLFRHKMFVASKPTLGDQAPDLKLKTLDGEEVNLSAYLGKPLVIVKGSYT